MNKNINLLSNKIPVDKGPLEVITKNSKDIESISHSNLNRIDTTEEFEDHQKSIKENENAKNIYPDISANIYNQIFSESLNEKKKDEKLSPQINQNKSNSFNDIYPNYPVFSAPENKQGNYVNEDPLSGINDDNKRTVNTNIFNSANSNYFCNTNPDNIKNNNNHSNKNNLNNPNNKNTDYADIPEDCQFYAEKSEDLLIYEEIQLLPEEAEIFGYAYLTNYRIVLKLAKPLKNIKNLFNNYPQDYFEVPLFLINKLERFSDKKSHSHSKYVIEIGTKDQRIVKFFVYNEDKSLYNHLHRLITPKDFSDFLKYANRYREAHPVNNDGWKIYKMKEEFDRQGVIYDVENFVNEIKKTKINGDEPKFRFTNLNLNFELCQTYPRKLIVPKSMTDEDLKMSSTFRTKCRIPTLCWFDIDIKSSLWRSSQTKSGLTQQRNNFDEKLLKHIAETSNGKISIFDARPYLNALANRFKGAGFENTDNYINSEIIFCEIDNIHSVKNSYNKLISLCNNRYIHENKKFFSLLEQTGWFDFNHQIIKSAIEIAACLKKGNSVLIHCSDGWDRSSQLTSMTQLLIDPYYRTLKGFLILIQKEWLSFGHQFGYRNGFYIKELSQDERSPIFLQWLDCVYQLLYQYPNLFEFNNQLLLFLAYHLNTAKYGTFLFNNEYERKLKCYNAKNMTVSIWTDILESVTNSNDKNIPFIAENLNEKKEFNFLNPFYNETANYSNKRLKPNYGYNKLRLWEEYFFRYVIFPENGKFSCEFPIFKTILQDDKSIKNMLNLLNTKKKTITHSNFYELDKQNELNVIKDKDKEIEELKETIRDLCLNLGFSISDYNILTNKTKKNLEIISNSLPNEKDGYIIFKPNK